MREHGTAVHYDMYDRDIYTDPYDVFRRLRDEAPVFHNEELDFYAVSRHEDVLRVMSDRDTFRSGRGGSFNIIRQGVQMPPGMFIYEDPPMHSLHRGLVSRLFTPRATRNLEPEIRQLCAEIVDSLEGRASFDFMKDFALRLPVQVIGMLVGVPKEDQPSLLECFQKTMHESSEDRESNLMEGILESARWFNDYLDWREQHPTDDVMSQLIRDEFEDADGVRRTLRRDEIITYLTLITSAGSDTTSMALGWAGCLLGEHPEQRRELVADPSLIPDAVEEVLRFESPAYHNCRTVLTDVELHGVTIPAGGVIVMLPPSANRDERKWDEPERFDIHREPAQIFTFGFGPHFCLGANLARLETRLALEALLPRVPDWSVDREHAVLAGGTDTRGWDRLPVLVEAG